MKIYFAASIRGGRDDDDFYVRLVEALSRHGEVLTEHVGDKDLTEFGESDLSDPQIWDRDMSWLEEADVLVAEVTTPSLGVGYEIGKAEMKGKPILCLYRERAGKRLSAMINGCVVIYKGYYEEIQEAVDIADDFLVGIKSRKKEVGKTY